MQDRGIMLSVSEEAKHKLSEPGYHPAFGARPLRRVIQQYVEDGITDLVLDDDSVQRIGVALKDEKIVVEKIM